MKYIHIVALTIAALVVIVKLLGPRYNTWKENRDKTKQDEKEDSKPEKKEPAKVKGWVTPITGLAILVAIFALSLKKDSERPPRQPSMSATAEAFIKSRQGDVVVTAYPCEDCWTDPVVIPKGACFGLATVAEDGRSPVDRALKIRATYDGGIQKVTEIPPDGNVALGVSVYALEFQSLDNRPVKVRVRFR